MGATSVDEGWAALRKGDSETARRIFEDAVEREGSGAAFEGLGAVRYVDHDYTASISLYERAYAANRDQGDTMGAGRAAMMIAWITGGILGDWAVQNGWWARARRVLESAGEDAPDYGCVLILKAYQEPDAAAREALLHAAIAVGRRFGDPNIEFEALSYLGGLFVMTDRTQEGMALFDEALAGACASEVTDMAILDSIFCGFFWACELVNDIPRAEQWMRAAQDVMERRKVVAAFCRAHYGGILTAAGRWSEAENELLQAAGYFDAGVSPRRAVVMIRLAELRVKQGRLEEAALLLEGLDHHPDAVRTLAALHLAGGRTEIARDLLERATEGRDDDVPTVGESTMIGPLLALLVDVYLQEERVEDARSAADRLRRIAELQQGAYLRAVASFAAGLVCVAEGGGDARPHFRDALTGFAEARVPMEAARARLEIARALTQSPEAAIAHAKAALDVFERLDAARHADAAGALLRSLGAPVRTGVKGTGALTKREAEVLRLLAAGYSNREIGERLFITRKTVEHHVGNVLSKLGLRNRAEAAAYATREKIGP